MTSAYAILASVELLHEYYADARCPDFSIRPDDTTASLLRGSGILHRQIGNVLILLTKVGQDGIATRILPAETVLRFQLQLEQPRMLNYTNLELPQGYAYHFSNRPEIVGNNTSYLNRTVPAFDAGASYAIAALAAQGGTVYEAIRPVVNNDHAPGDTAYWEPRNADRYVHSQDLIPRSDGRIRISVAPAEAFTIETFAFNPVSGAIDQPVGTQERQQYETAVATVAVDRSHIRPGRYRLRVNGVDSVQMIDPAGEGSRSLGCLELWNLADGNNPLSLYRTDGTPRGAAFSLRFANRLARWKYRLRTGAATGVNIPGQPGAFAAGPEPLEFVSVRPLPLRQEALRNLQLMRGPDVLASRLANPPPERISVHTESGLSWYCAEMRLNY